MSHKNQKQGGNKVLWKTLDLIWWVQITDQCRRFKKLLTYKSGVLGVGLNELSKQENVIYHCCMLYLKDPGTPGTFQTWRPQKSRISPSSGELSPLQSCAQCEVIQRRCFFHKRILAVNVSLYYTTVTLFILRTTVSGILLWEKRASRRLETRRSHGEERTTTTVCPLFFSQNRKPKKWRKQKGSLTTRSRLVTACPTLRKTLKKRLHTLPRWFPSAESAQSCGRSGLREGAVDSDLSFTRRATVTRATVGPRSVCAQWADLRWCLRRKCQRQKRANNSHPEDRKSAMRSAFTAHGNTWKAATDQWYFSLCVHLVQMHCG